MLENTQDVCRLCLSKEGLMLPIFRKRILKNETAFRSKIMSCAPVEIFADDELPSKVCHLCVHQVEKFFQFQAMCENSDAVLRSQLKNSVTQEVTDLKANIFSLGKQNCVEDQKPDLLSDYQTNKYCLQEKTNFDVLTCFVCSLISLTNDLLIDHLTVCHPDVTLFFCKGCKLSFSNINLFKTHLALQHSFTCNQCDFVFKHENSLQDHLKCHVGENFICKHCPKVFNDEVQLKNHELTHSEKTCSSCSKELESKQEYYSHIKECGQKYPCKFCKQTLELKKDLIEHVNNYHDSCTLQKCNMCQETFVPSELQQHHCETFVEQIFQCQNCQANFSDESSLINHMSTEHSDDVLTCKFCTKKFSLKSSLKRHEKSHSGVKPYQCKYCPRKFKDSSACVVHTRTHTGEHPFQCQECHKDFKQLANLKMHTYRHHKKNKKSPEEKPEELNQEQHHDYEHLYTGDIVDNYSSANMRSYQNLNESITTFNQSMNILMSDHA